MRLTASLDTETLPPAEADHLRRLVAAARFFDQPTSRKSATREADRFQYRVTVEDGGRVKRVELDESSVPETSRSLFDYLTNCARAAQTKKRS